MLKSPDFTFSHYLVDLFRISVHLIVFPANCSARLLLPRNSPLELLIRCVSSEISL